MASLWDKVGAAVHKTAQEVEAEAFSAWITREMAETDCEILAYVGRYRVTTPEEIEEAIRTGRIEGHPAWEDLIDWANLNQYREQLLILQTSLKQEQSNVLGNHCFAPFGSVAESG